MPDTTIDQENGFDAGREREQIMNAGRMLERLAKHWDYIGDLQGRRGTKEYWKVNNGLMKLCGAEWPGDKPDFAENMEGRSMEEMEEVINEALKTLNNYVSRQSTFFGFLARLFNPLANMKMEDADIAIRKLQSIKNSMVRLREHNESLDIHPEREAEETQEENRNPDPSAGEDIEREFTNDELSQGYEQFCEDHSDQISKINSNRISDLREIDEEFGEDNEELREYLNHRISGIEKLNDIEEHADEYFKKRQAEKPEIVKNSRNEVTKVVLKNVTKPEMQQTTNGGWSAVLSSMLKQKGVDIDQETICVFRPDPAVSGDKRSKSGNSGRDGSISQSREMILKLVPDTALNAANMVVANFSPEDRAFVLWTDEQREKKLGEVKDKLRTVIRMGVEKDGAAVALTIGGQYLTAYGLEKTVAENEKVIETVYLHDPDSPEKTTMTLDELAEKCYQRISDEKKSNLPQEYYTFSAQWLQDLTDDLGNLKLDAALTEKGVSYGEDNLLKCQNLKPVKRNCDAERTNWRELDISKDKDLTMTVYLPTNVKKLMKNRVKESVRQEEFHRDREKKPKKSLFCRQTENSRKSDEQKNESMENNRVK